MGGTNVLTNVRKLLLQQKIMRYFTSNANNENAYSALEKEYNNLADITSDEKNQLDSIVIFYAIAQLATNNVTSIATPIEKMHKVLQMAGLEVSPLEDLFVSFGYEKNGRQNPISIENTLRKNIRILRKMFDKKTEDYTNFTVNDIEVNFQNFVLYILAQLNLQDISSHEVFESFSGDVSMPEELRRNGSASLGAEENPVDSDTVSLTLPSYDELPKEAIGAIRDAIKNQRDEINKQIEIAKSALARAAKANEIAQEIQEQLTEKNPLEFKSPVQLVNAIKEAHTNANFECKECEESKTIGAATKHADNTVEQANIAEQKLAELQVALVEARREAEERARREAEEKERLEKERLEKERLEQARREAEKARLEKAREAEESARREAEEARKAEERTRREELLKNKQALEAIPTANNDRDSLSSGSVSEEQALKLANVLSSYTGAGNPFGITARLLMRARNVGLDTTIKNSKIGIENLESLEQVENNKYSIFSKGIRRIITDSKKIDKVGTVETLQTKSKVVVVNKASSLDTFIRIVSTVVANEDNKDTVSNLSSTDQSVTDKALDTLVDTVFEKINEKISDTKIPEDKKEYIKPIITNYLAACDAVCDRFLKSADGKNLRDKGSKRSSLSR